MNYLHFLNDNELYTLEKEKDTQKSLYLFRIARYQNVQSMIEIAKLYVSDNNDERSFYWFEKASQMENKYAKYRLAIYYHKGIYVEKDNIQALKLFKESINNISSSLYRIRAIKFLIDICTEFEKDMKTEDISFQICLELAYFENIDPRIYEKLGRYYELGIGTNCNPEEFKKWNKIAANNGRYISMAKYGTILENEGNYEEALQWYKKSNIKYAHCRIANMHEKGFHFNQNFQEAFEIYQNINSGNAKFHLAPYYLNGYCCPIDIKKTFQLYLESGQMDNRLACYKLGEIYENPGEFSDIVEKDLSLSLFWYEKGAPRNADCCHKTGLFYENAPGYEHIVPLDLEKAQFWFKRGFQMGNQNCLTKIYNLTPSSQP